MTPTPRVAAQIAGLSLDRTGHLPDNVYLAMAVRGALLIDLAIAGRLAQTEGSIELDSTPVGWLSGGRPESSEAALVVGRGSSPHRCGHSWVLGRWHGRLHASLDDLDGG